MKISGQSVPWPMGSPEDGGGGGVAGKGGGCRHEGRISRDTLRVFCAGVHPRVNISGMDRDVHFF